jgi:hypothetical protein
MATKRRRRATTSTGDAVRVDFVILADFAEAVGGKLYLMGGAWNIYRAQQYPTTIPFGLGIGILVPWSFSNEKFPLSFTIRKSEGPELLSGGGEFEVGREAGIPQGMTQRVTIGMSGQVQLPEPGSYEIHVRAADDEMQVSFEAITIPAR